jgi:hypothetical protein
MKKTNDIPELLDDALAGEGATYIDFGQQKRVQQALQRWPLLSDLDRQKSVEVDEAGRITGGAGDAEKK